LNNNNRDPTATTASNTGQGALIFWKSSMGRNKYKEQALDISADGQFAHDHEHDDDHSQTPYSPLAS